jgi:transposase InsO family protein
MKPTSNDSSQALALERYALLSQIQELIRQGLPLSVALQQVSCTPITRADGTQRLYARRTIEDWWYEYQHGGFAALQPKSRSDKGSSRVMTAEQRQFILAQVQAQPAVPVEVLYRRWTQTDPNLPSMASIYRLLRAHQLDSQSRRRQLRQPLGGATKAFETPAVNELWMADFSPGPFLHPPNASRALATHLCLIVDDHSRLVPYAAYYARADTEAFLHTFQQAIRRRGLPMRLYTDQGGPFTNDHTRVVCARLGIRLLHAKPYHAWSKGKVERLCATIQQDFEATLRLPGEAVFSLCELNGKFSHWLQSVYHARVHSATACSPQERYQRGAHLVRSLDPHLDLDVLFYTEVVRVVRRDGTVRLGSRLYEVDLSLRSLSVQLRFDPFRMDRIEVWYKATSFGLAKAVDLNLNSQLLQSHPYEKPTQS